jgi:putative ABC transport system substrate-binding protein
MSICLRRREFISGLGGAAAWPLAARAQQGDRVRRIGVLRAADENVAKLTHSAFAQALADLGWTDGRNVRMDLRLASDDTNLIRAFARELVGLQPDLILASSVAVTVALQQETRTIPIVFANVADPRRRRYRPAAQPTGRERHRLRQLGSHAGRQVAGTALGDRAWAQAGRNDVQS